MKALNLFFSGIDKFSHALRWISYFCLVALIIVVDYEVVSRFIFNRPTSFAFDIALAFQVILVAMGAAFVLRDEGHVSITLVTELLPKRADHYFLSITSVFCAVVMGLMTYQMLISSVGAWKLNELSETLGLPLAPVKSFLTMGFATLTLQFLVRSWKHFLIIRGI